MTGNVKQDLEAHREVRFFLPERFTMLFAHDMWRTLMTLSMS